MSLEEWKLKALSKLQNGQFDQIEASAKADSNHWLSRVCAAENRAIEKAIDTEYEKMQQDYYVSVAADQYLTSIGR
jgi:hypothetical protein